MQIELVLHFSTTPSYVSFIEPIKKNRKHDNGCVYRFEKCSSRFWSLMSATHINNVFKQKLTHTNTVATKSNNKNEERREEDKNY